MSYWDAPGEPVTFEDATSHDFASFVPLSTWGRPWGTTWFRLTGVVPSDWQLDERYEAEVVVDPGFSTFMPGFQAEGTFWTTDGRIIKGLEPLNDWVSIDGGQIDVFLEAAHNPIVPEPDNWVTPTPMGDRKTAGDKPVYTFKRADVVLVDTVVWELERDIWVLRGLFEQLSASSTRRAGLLAAFEDMMAAVDPHDIPGTAQAGRDALAPALAEINPAPAHRLHAVGHAHIDCAWLWPVRETRRKCARTFSNALDLMDRDPNFRFAASSAQQYAWIEEDYPELFERIRKRVAEGRFIPVGGMWVESDTNMPSGEALARQFIEGTKYFTEKFDVESDEVWLPDSFGYTGAMPQIARSAGKKYFLTQKISWNDTNTFPHSSFDWEGIDGTRILTHFPPSDTYGALISGEELAKSERQNSEKGRNDTALLLFGFGDGGGGPTREMLGAARRTRDLAGSPKVELSTPAEFFSELDENYVDRPVWTGEMYLEYHRATYTSQHRTKVGNRRNESLLHEAELWCATAALRAGFEYPYDELQKLWRMTLLLQFHDILPGTSIAWVSQDAEHDHAYITGELERIIGEALAALAGDGNHDLVANAAPFDQSGAQAFAITPRPDSAPLPQPVQAGDTWTLDNEHVRLVVDARGEITSLVDLTHDRELLVEGMPANRLHLFTDVPNEWDAWDINHFYTDRDQVWDDAAIEATDEGLRIVRKTEHSTLIETISLVADAPEFRLSFDVDWHETQKLLKLDLPLDVHAPVASSEIQFGYIQRPTHRNTSWDQARFETCAQRWVHVGEAEYGVAIANSATYGYDVRSVERPGGGAMTVVRPSLLRAPKFPDPDADQGAQHLDFTVRLGASIADAVELGYAQNLPARHISGATEQPAIVTCEGDGGVVIETVKLAEDRSGDLVVRLYESRGARSSAVIRTTADFATYQRTDLLERGDAADPVADGVELTLRPFELVTLRFIG